jgi:hypothetical protein
LILARNSEPSGQLPSGGSHIRFDVFHDCLVVVGGWVPDLLLPGAEDPRGGSIDVDLALDTETQRRPLRRIAEALAKHAPLSQRRKPHILGFFNNNPLGAAANSSAFIDLRVSPTEDLPLMASHTPWQLPHCGEGCRRRGWYAFGSQPEPRLNG